MTFVALSAAGGTKGADRWTPPPVTVASHGVRAVGKPKFCRTGQVCTKEAPGPIRPAVPVARGGRVYVDFHTRTRSVTLPPYDRDYATIRRTDSSGRRWTVVFRRVTTAPLIVWLDIKYPRGGGLLRFIVERRDPRSSVRLAG
jgi:hypothetical protein